ALMRSGVCTSPRTSFSPFAVMTTVRRPGTKRTSCASTMSARLRRSFKLIFTTHVSGKGEAGQAATQQARARASSVMVAGSKTARQGVGRCGCGARRGSVTHNDDGAALLVQNAMPAFRHWWVSPLEQPRGVPRGEVDAAVTARAAEFVVPIGAVQGETPVKVLD